MAEGDLAIATVAVTRSAAELNIMDGVTATTGEVNYLDVTTVGTAEASKAVTVSAGSKITLGAIEIEGSVFDIDGGVITGITDLLVADGGTGAGTFTDGGVLLGSGTGAFTAMAVLGDGAIIVGDNATDPVALSAFTSSTGTLKHESGGIEADISAIADGGIVVGTGAGTMAIRASFLTAGAAGFVTHELGGLEFDASGVVDSDFLVGTGAGTMGIESGATVRTSLGLGTGNTVEFEKLGIISAHDLGVGLHVKSGDAGGGAIHANADEVVIEGATDAGMTILSGDAGGSSIHFESASSTSAANRFLWAYAAGAEYLQTIVDGTAMMHIMEGKVGIENTSLESWEAVRTVLQIGGDLSLFARTTQVDGGGAGLVQNAYYDATNGRWEYISTNDNDEASGIIMGDGLIRFNVTSVAGAGDAAVTWTDALTIENDGDLKSQGGYLLEGYATGRNVVRSLRLKITGNTDETKCTFETEDVFNGEAFGSELVVSGATGTNFDFIADGTVDILPSQTVIAVLAANVQTNDTGTDYWVYGRVSGGDIRVDLAKGGAGTWADYSNHGADFPNGKVVYVLITYVTSS